MALIENIVDGHGEVLEWQDDLVVQVPSPNPIVRLIIVYEHFDDSLCTIKVSMSTDAVSSAATIRSLS